jgi:hypothetical protein
MYGRGVLWDEQRARFLPAVVGSNELHRHGRLIRAHGVDPRNLSDRSRYHLSHVARISVAAWLGYERWLRRRYEVRYPAADAEHDPGPHVILSAAAAMRILQDASAVEAMQAEAVVR